MQLEVPALELSSFELTSLKKLFESQFQIGECYRVLKTLKALCAMASKLLVELDNFLSLGPLFKTGSFAYKRLEEAGIEPRTS